MGVVFSSLPTPLALSLNHYDRVSWPRHSRMNTRLKLRDKALILVGVPLVLQMIAFGSLFMALKQSEANVAAQEHAKQLNFHFNKLAYNLLQAATSLHLNSLETQAERKRFLRAVKVARNECNILSIMLSEEPGEIRAIPELTALRDTVSRCLVYIDEVSHRLDFGEFQSALEQVSNLKRMSSTLIARSSTMSIAFQAISERSSKNETRARQAFQHYLIAFVIADIVLALALITAFNSDTTGRLATLMDNTNRFAHGQPLLTRVAGQDEIAHLDSTFHDMADAIATSARHKQEFMAMIAHDIRTPLSTINVGLGILSAKVASTGDPSVPKLISGLEDNAQRVLKLISDLLDVEKMAAGMMDITCEDVPVAHILEASWQAVRHLADLKHVKLDIPTSDSECYGDSDRLIQVLTNLLSNAVKYAPEASTITVTLAETPDWLEVVITDQGPGVPDEFKVKIFERFQQVSTAEHKPIGGTGLGLAICKEIIQLHHGQIGVRNAEPQGSQFWFTVPKTRPVGPAKA